MSYKLICDKCEGRVFTVSKTPYAFMLFVKCDWCGHLYAFSHDNEFPTSDDDNIKRRAILFRRFV